MERKKTFAENPTRVVSKLAAAHGLVQVARQKMDSTPTKAQKKQLSAAEGNFRAQIDYASTRPDVLGILHQYIIDLLAILPDRAEVFVADIDTAMARITAKRRNRGKI